eukprot:TRINITY_DN14244_c0_g1_i1.p1 TRINITY_DN14244_c0_g1~~TRINITY_DN14244_c0_g1_i1.p1  ORF type:complete len:185 (-),score=77.15 TRINITY_DN14244_c0_g1_i1:138-692(-)
MSSRGKANKKKKQKAKPRLPLPPASEEPLEYEYVNQDDRYRNASELVVDFRVDDDNEVECTTLAHAIYQHRLLYGHLASSGLVNPDMKYVPYLYGPNNIQEMQGYLEANEGVKIPETRSVVEMKGGRDLGPDEEKALEKERKRFKKIEAEIKKQIEEIDKEISAIHQALEEEERREEEQKKELN